MMIQTTRLRSVVRFVPLLVILLTIPLSAKAMEGKLTRFELPNGLKVIIHEDHARKVAAIQYWVMVGSANEEPSERGISHLIEHMAFKGTKTRGVGKIAGEIEALGGDINAYTSWDQTVFFVTVPSAATAKGLDILTDAVLNPVIDPGELAKEKEVVIEEILEGEERPERKASKLLFKTAYTRSPYRFPIIGYKKTVEKLTRDDILAFRKKWYVPENMFVLIVGDVHPGKLKTEIERLTAGFKPKGFFRPPEPTEPVQKKLRSAVLRDANARETRLSIAFHIPSLAGFDVNALDLAADILGSRESSRLIRVVKKEKGLVNSIYANSLTPKRPGLFVIGATLQGKNLEAATKAVMKEVTRLRDTPPSRQELDRAKTNIESEHVYSLETVAGTARSLGSFQADLGDALYEKKYLELNAAVKAPEVSKAVGKYLGAPNVTVTVLVPEGEVPNFHIEKLARIIESSAKVKTAALSETSSARVLTRTLSNGIRVVLMPDDSNPLLSFKIACLGGKRFETKETEGIMNFIAHMVTKGAGKMSEVEISREIEDMGGRLNGFSGYDSFGISTTFFSRHMDKGLKLLAKVYSDPTFPQDKLDRERTLIINRIKTEPDRPVRYAIKVLNEVLYPRHPYGFDKEGTIATVSGFTRDDLRETYQRFAVPSNTVITGVGDMDAANVMERIADVFGTIPAKKFDAPIVPKEEPLKKVREKVMRIPRAKAHLMIGFRGTTLSDSERYPLEVLNNVLAGQGGRLFLQLRDKESLGYVVASFERSRLDPGMFAFYVACEASKVDQAIKSLMREINRVRSAPVTEQELERSKNNLIGTHQINLQSSWSRAENTALNTLYGLGYDYDAKHLKRISEVTADGVLKAARKFLDPKHCVVVKILPEQK
ncbi:MAG: pitrilysin family protein [Deltaproteobacteria bacterium]